MSIVVNKTRLPVTQWQTESGSVVSISDARKRYAKSLSVALEPIQSGSGDPSPDNIRPISGRSSVTAYDDPKYGGKIWWNQLFVPVTEWKAEAAQTSISISEGVITATLVSGSPSVFAPAIRPKSGISVTTVANHLYYCSCKFKASTDNYPYLRNNTAFTTANVFGTEITSAGTWGSYENIVSASSDGGDAWYIGHTQTKTLQVGDYFSIKDMMCIDLTAMFGAGNEPTLEQFRALFPKDYYEYNAGTETLVSAVNGDPYWNVTVSLGQTVYGGSLDVVSGVLTVTHGYLNLNTANMNNNEDYPGWRDSGVLEIIGSGLNVGLYNAFTNISPIITSGHWAVGANTRNNGSTLFLNTLYFHKTQTEWQALAMDVQFVIPLATPQTIQLTAHQIEMLMLNNTVWSDAGQVTLEYAKIRS